MVHIDHNEFIAVATIVVRYNKYMYIYNRTPESVAFDMECIADGMDKPGYISTAGYMLTAYNHPHHGLAVKPSVSHCIF